MNPLSSIAGRPATPSNPVIPVTQHPDMDTPLPSTELPYDNLIEASDPTERHRIRNRVNGRVRANTPYLGTNGLDWTPLPPFSDTSGGLRTSRINQNPLPGKFAGRATRSPNLDWHTPQERPGTPFLDRNDVLPQAVTYERTPFSPPSQVSPFLDRNDALPQALRYEHTPFSPPLAPFDSEDSSYPNTNVSGTGGDLYSSQQRSTPAPAYRAYRAYRTPRPHGTGTKVWSGTQSLPAFVPERELRGQTPRYPSDDDSHCKRATGVKSVNAYLDATKAKKPLKMLITSCTSCREGKLRCDRKYPRCGRCERLGVVCKWENP